MAMMGVDSGSLYRRTYSLSRLAWSWVGGRLAPFAISSNEPGELSQWLCHDDSTINIVLELLLLLSIANEQRVAMYRTHHAHQFIFSFFLQFFVHFVW